RHRAPAGARQARAGQRGRLLHPARRPPRRHQLRDPPRLRGGAARLRRGRLPAGAAARAGRRAVGDRPGDRGGVPGPARRAGPPRLPGQPPGLAMRIVFMGSPEFALPSLRAVLEHHEVALVVTQPDKPAGRGKGLAAPPVKRLAEEAGVPVYQPPSARKPEVAERLRATGAELAVVVAYGKILPRAVLEAFPRGCVNVHASVLPRYRGAAPIQWALIRGERETGVTIMQLDEGMDTGPMLLVRREPIRDEDTAGTLSQRLAELG